MIYFCTFIIGGMIGYALCALLVSNSEDEERDV